MVDIDELMSSIIPINKLNRGELGKFLNDLGDETKIIVKNNEAIGVIMSPKTYKKLINIRQEGEQ